jgi:hypothetical protein
MLIWSYGATPSTEKIRNFAYLSQVFPTWARPDDHVQDVIFKTGQLGLAWKTTPGHDEGKRSG